MNMASITLELWYILHTKMAACGTFFGLPPWNQYINGGACTEPNLTTPDEIFDAIPLIGLAVLDMLLRVAGVAAVLFVIYGGIQFMVSQGNSDATKSARNTILNALIGLIIASIAATMVSFIGRRIGGSN
jgi:ABC-type Fe3+ transport system permease subunit